MNSCGLPNQENKEFIQLGQLDISSEHGVKFIEECEAKSFSEGFRNQ